MVIVADDQVDIWDIRTYRLIVPTSPSSAADKDHTCLLVLVELGSGVRLTCGDPCNFNPLPVDMPFYRPLKQTASHTLFAAAGEILEWILSP